MSAVQLDFFTTIAESAKDRRRRINREAAKRWRLKNPEKRKEIKRRSDAKRMAADPDYNKKAYRRNLEKNRAKHRAFKARERAKNPDLVRERFAQYQRANKELFSGYAKKWYAQNKDTARALLKQWHEKNPEKRAEFTARRKAAKMAQLHPSADRAAISRLHREAARRNREGGEVWNVDHIIPLSAGGWEHEANMQLLPRSINISKHANPFWFHPEFLNWTDVPRHLWPAHLVPWYLAAMLKMETAQ